MTAAAVRPSISGRSVLPDAVRVDELAAIGNCEDFAYDVAFGAEEAREDSVVVVVDLGVFDLHFARARVERAVGAYVDGVVVDGVVAEDVAVTQGGDAEDGVVVFVDGLERECFERAFALVADAPQLAEEGDLLVEDRFLYDVVAYVGGVGGDRQARHQERGRREDE